MQVIQRAATDVGAIPSTCPYCGVGCGVLIETQGGRIVGVRGDPAHPANRGRLCSKGSNLHLTATPEVLAQARLLQPMRRTERHGVAHPVSWDQAMGEAAARLADALQRHGPDALGFYVSGQFLTEDYYVFNKLVKGVLGSNHIDSNSRLCMSSAVAGYKATLGSDAPPTCYEDVDHAACIFIAGANPAWAHPILFRRIEAAKARNPNLKIVLVDPRRTDCAELADLVLQVQSGTDVLLFHGLLHIMLWEGWVDQAFIDAHTEGFAELKALVRDCTPERVAQVCGVRVPDLLQAARWFAGVGEGQAANTRRPTLSLYCQGLNQSSSGTDKNTALINLHLATGQIGKPGAGPFSLTGQPNAMGGREVGGMANLLSAHRDLGHAQHRAEVAALWGVPSVPQKPGRTAVEMFQAAADGEVKALWIACTNPAQSLPDQRTVRRALERAEFVVVQEAFATTATCAYADLLLPATTWGEKEGTVTNSERCISRVRAAVAAPGLARHDWQIGVDLAQRLEALLHPGRKSGFSYDSPESVWNEHRESTRGRDLDITGLSYAVLDRAGPQPWPMKEGASQGQARLYQDHRFALPSGRARFVASAYRPVSEPCDARYPLTLNTGRLRDQWHGMSRTGVVAQAYGHAPEPALLMHPQDMRRRSLQPGDLARVRSRRGAVCVPVQPSAEMALGQVFLAMHWGSENLGGRDADGVPLAGVNALTLGSYCPQSRQPELKAAAVEVCAHDAPWRMLAMAWFPQHSVWRVRAALQALLPQFDFAVCVPMGRSGADAAGAPGRVGLLLRAAHAVPVAGAVLEQIEAAFGLQHPAALRYDDARLGQRRVVALQGQGEERRLCAFMLAGDVRSQAWLRALLENGDAVGNNARRLLLAQSEPPLATRSASRLVCSCLGVSEAQINEQLAQQTGTAEQKLLGLQQHLKCGTSCGSCVPELKRMVRAA